MAIESFRRFYFTRLYPLCHLLFLEKNHASIDTEGRRYQQIKKQKEKLPFVMGEKMGIVKT